MKTAAAALLLVLCLDVGAAAVDGRFEDEIRPLLGRYCVDCHGGEKAKGDVDLGRFTGGVRPRTEPALWQSVAQQLVSGDMPPEDKPQPTVEERNHIVSWIEALLDELAEAGAGDPGPIVLRRLSNAEYTYTLRDLTGIASLDPAREFPVDGAAGEGFMNTASALVMSPVLVSKYLDAAREVARHLVLLPDGIRFSPATSQRDRTEEILERIRAFYRRYTASGGGSRVNLQGIVFETNAGGRLPIEDYLGALLAERERGLQPPHELNSRYLDHLRTALDPARVAPASPLVDTLRQRWATAGTEDLDRLVAWIQGWQQALWRFNSVGHIGKVGGPPSWQEPVTPIVARQSFRVPVPEPAPDGSIVMHLSVGDAGDGSAHDWVRWENPRFTRPGEPDLLLRDIRAEVSRRSARRDQLFSVASAALAAAAEVQDSADGSGADIEALAARHGLSAADLRAWLGVLGMDRSAPSLAPENLFSRRLEDLAGHDFVDGWGFPETPSAVANASGTEVRIPGRLPGHRIALHPSPTRAAVAAWRSPARNTITVSARVRHAHPECGNGVTWTLELRQGARVRRLASGTAHGDREVPIGPFEPLRIGMGDVVALAIGPRDGNHACDLTLVDLEIRGSGTSEAAWSLAGDVAGDILGANPHPDAHGNADVWHLLSEPLADSGFAGWSLPAGSILDRWLAAEDEAERNLWATRLAELLRDGTTAADGSPDARLLSTLRNLGGPLLSVDPTRPGVDFANAGDWGPPPGLFGKHPDGAPAAPGDLVVHGPWHLEFRVPSELVHGRDFVVDGMLDAGAGPEGSVQLGVGIGPAPAVEGLRAGGPASTAAGGRWTDGPQKVVPDAPVVAAADSPAWRRFEADFAKFRDLFPAALCYEKIVPVDEVVTLTLFHREDGHLVRLMLDDEATAEIHRLWDELHYVSRDALSLVDAFEQLWQFATQDADPSAFEPLREPIRQRAESFRRILEESEPAHIAGLLRIASTAWRRPLTASEADGLRQFYRELRIHDLTHEEAIQSTLARILTSPSFLYHVEQPVPGESPGPVTPWELASRLSYFLWSGPPDDALLQQARRGDLLTPDVLASETRRMLRDPKVRRLAIEFGCAWLQIHGFDTLDEKSERHFPMFAEVRGDLYEEAIRFIGNQFASNRPLMEMLDADHTFVNGRLAQHYGIPGITEGEWRRVDGIRKYGRGGLLGFGAILAKQSGASRTSPILRGNWLCEVLLGEHLPRPPAGVPPLPDTEDETEGLTVRELVERHSKDPNCVVCHRRIDPYGYSLEAYDAIGRHRLEDLGGRPVNTSVMLADGTTFEGMEGLRQHLTRDRREAFAGQFCRKLLGYALGRTVQLSDRPLLRQMRDVVLTPGTGLADVVVTLSQSPQFTTIRGRDARQPQ